MEVRFLKVKIGKRPNGHADHPDWTKLPITRGDPERSGLFMIDGWKYDNDCGHDEVREGDERWDSPYGMQWGCLIVTPQFADQALSYFPKTVSEISEAEFESFYDRFHAIRMSEDITDSKVLQDLKNQLVLDDAVVLHGSVGSAISPRKPVLTARALCALDPDDPEPGVRRNRRKRWVSCRRLLGIEQPRST